MNINIKFTKTSKINLKTLEEILNLKSQVWKFKKKDQLNWFKKNITQYDYHVILTFKKQLVGYTALREQNLLINKKIKRKFFLFDTHVIHKKFRGKLFNNLLLSSLMMKKINFFLKKKRKISFLLCRTKMVNYYKFHQWKIINKSIVNIKNKKIFKIMYYGSINKNNKYELLL